MDRHARKRIVSKISNFIWSAAILFLLVVGGWWVLMNWVLPWLGAMDTAM